VRASLFRRVPAIAFLVAALVVTLLVGGHTGAVALAVYLAVLTAIVAFACARAVAGGLPLSPLLGRPRVPGKPQQPPKLPQLAWIEGRVSRAYGSSAGVEELRPILAQVVSAELERTRGVSLERTPERARRLLGEGLWALVAGVGDDHPALEVAQLRRLIDELEETWADDPR